MKIDAIRNLLISHYLEHDPLAIRPIDRGMENENYVVETDKGKYVLRVYSLSHATTGPRTRSEMVFELDWIDHLRRRKVPTPAVIPTREGARLVEAVEPGRAKRQPRFAALFEYIAGDEAAAYDAANARSVAETLLQIRRATRGFTYTTIRPWPGDIIGLSLSFFRKNRLRTGRYQPALERLYEAAAAGYRQIQSAGLPRGVIHGDIKLENLLFSGSQVRAVLDFDDYRQSYLLEELTRTIMHDLDSPTRNAIRAGVFPIFQQAFASDSAITPDELAHLPTFLKARFIYDLTAYLLNDNHSLVDALFADPQVEHVILK